MPVGGKEGAEEEKRAPSHSAYPELHESEIELEKLGDMMKSIQEMEAQ